jgi:16S rRNA C1402 (ribose-2'-O) methylase RsmI
MVFLGFELTKLFEKKIRGPCRQIFEDITNPKVVKQSHLKGEVTVVIAPFIEEYNESLKAKKIINQEEEEEEENKDDEEDTKEIQKMSKIFFIGFYQLKRLKYYLWHRHSF